MRDVQAGRNALAALLVLGIFRRKPATPNRLEVRVKTATPPPPPPKPEPPQAPIKRDLLFKDLHADVNPSAHVRVKTMACGDCQREFRYFTNSDGKPTVARCPGCGRRHSVS